MKLFKASEERVEHDSTHCIGTRLFPEQMPRRLRGNGTGSHVVRKAGDDDATGRIRNGTAARIVR